MSLLPRPDDWDAPVTLLEMDPPERILIPFDGSHAAERALGWAALTARGTDAELIVVVAYDPPLTVRGRGATYVEEVRGELAAEAQELAEEAVRLLVARGVRARAIVVQGDPARAILDVADDDDCELIVIGRQGLTAELGGVTGAMNRFRELLTGGVADKIVRYATVPVLVVA